MNYRKSAPDATWKRAWRSFVAKNGGLFDAAGLPLLARETAEHLGDLLTHGIFDHHADPSGFSTDSLSEDQYRAVVSLATNYFAAGFPWSTPMALRQRDQNRLQKRFGTR